MIWIRELEQRSDLKTAASDQNQHDSIQICTNMNTQKKTWRRGPESNRRIELLQSPALPLGYHALKNQAAKNNEDCRWRKGLFNLIEIRVANVASKAIAALKYRPG